MLFRLVTSIASLVPFHIWNDDRTTACHALHFSFLNTHDCYSISVTSDWIHKQICSVSLATRVWSTFYAAGEKRRGQVGKYAENVHGERQARIEQVRRWSICWLHVIGFVVVECGFRGGCSTMSREPRSNSTSIRFFCWQFRLSFQKERKASLR